MPMLLWFVTRAGPIRAGDILRAIAPATMAALGVLATLGPLRHSLDAFGASWRLVIAAALAALVAPLVLLALPSGRLVLLDTAASIRGIVSPRRSS
jgi:hypothetical protein